MKKIGFIGVGNMGTPMASNLLKKGYPVTVFDTVKEKVEAMAKVGAKISSSSKEAATGAEVVITMLPSSPHVEKAVLGKDGILEGVSPGSVYIDMSTIDPITTKKIAKIMAEKKVSMLDSPVTGGVSGAINATLTLYIGGDKEVLEEVRDVLESMGKTLHHMGEIGSGAMTKLVNNLCTGVITAATIEALVIGVKAGVDVDKLVAAVATGSGGSQVLNRQIKEYALKRRFEEVNFPVDLMLKDLDLAMATAKELNLPLLFGALAHAIYTMLKAKGRGKGFFPEVITIFEEYAGVEVRSRE